MKSQNLRNTILIVDDTADNINIMVEILKEDYILKIAKNGKTALEIAGKDKIDLILLDIMMPDMDGYQVLTELKNNPLTRNIPVIFVTAKNEIEDEAKGITLGAVDYIIKPVAPAIVQARAASHIKLKKTQEELKNVLNKTLYGSLKILTDILSLSNPDIFSQATIMGKLAKEIAEGLGLKNIWEFETAAMLSHVGCVTLQPDLMKKVSYGVLLSTKEQIEFNKYYRISAELLGKIPRFESISNMIMNKDVGINRHLLAEEILEYETKEIGRRILKVVFSFINLKNQKISFAKIIKEFKENDKIYDKLIVKTLESIIEKNNTQLVEKTIDCRYLLEGMIINKDIYSHQGQFLICKGTEISDTILQNLQKLSEMEKIEKMIDVLVPK